MRNDPSGDEPQVDQLRRENEALRERLETYRGLEEDLASQRVFEKARKHLVSWITFGGIALVVAGAFGLKEIYDLASSSAIDEATRRAGDAVKQVASEDVVLSLLEQSIDARLAPLNREIEEASAVIDDKLATLDESVAAIRKVITGAVEPPRVEAAATTPSGGGAAASDDEGEATPRADSPAAPAPAAEAARIQRSVDSQESTILTFDNRSRMPVTVYWMGYDGREIPYGTVAPGESLEQPTYATHPWIVRTADDDRRVGAIVAGPEPQTFTIAQDMIDGARADR